MRSKHPRLRFALLAAIPLEAINFWIIGYPAGPHSISRVSQIAAVALQWYLLHLPGIIAVDHSIMLREHPPFDSIAIFLTGLVDTALLVLFLLWLTGLVRRALRKLSSPMKQAA